MRKNNKNFIYSILLLILLSVGIGYAYLTSNLSITGSTKVTGNTWDIHFDNLVVNSNSVSATTPASIDPTNNTSINYAITLDKPGDFYEFNVDIVNAGSIPGKINLVTINGITSEVEDIIDYSITYSNNKLVQVNDILNANSSKNIKVRIYFIEDITPEDLLDTEANLNLTLSITYIQSNESEFDTNALIQQLKTESSTCFTKYEGQVTDQVGQTVTASNVYFNQCANKRNIIFNNLCWQMIRTTETGGTKMIYNGDVVDGKCLNTRGDHKGIVQNYSPIQTLSSSYLYGDSFTYDTTNNTFTLTDTTTATWSDSTYENLIGKFTCKTSSDTCTTLYNVNGYYSNTEAYASAYKIANTNYAQIGATEFNRNPYSPAMVGYMFNKVYKYTNSASTSGLLMGNDVSYSNGTYTLLPAAGESELGTTLDATHHYTCSDTIATCSKVRYYYYSSGSYNYYIELDGEANIEEAINNMLYNNNVNRYNSSIKGIIDAWYKQNLLSKTNMLEDTVYCNARNILNPNTNGWNKNGSMSESMNFKNYDITNDLSCLNITDQFAISNNKAKLTYPVALPTSEELYELTKEISFSDVLLGTNVEWWDLSPYNYYDNGAFVRSVFSYGDADYYTYVQSASGVRLVVTLSNGAVISSGDGSEESPWIVE